MKLEKYRSLSKVYKALEQKKCSFEYKIPAIWSDFDKKNEIVSVEPCSFYKKQIDYISGNPKQITKRKTEFAGDWIHDKIIYSFFPRHFTAFDHDQDGVLGNSKKDITHSEKGWSETGTFLKAIGLLPYLIKLGINVIHILPVTPSGKINPKGELGSPYAIKDYTSLDERLADSLIDIDVETQFKAFIEACHIAGIAVILEFVLRTASLDHVWIKKHPDWFYWIDESIPARKLGNHDSNSYGPPIFNHHELNHIKWQINSGIRSNLVEPHEKYKKWFYLPPESSSVYESDRGYSARTDDKKTITVPTAFADWPPDDIQPPWSDVTYLRLFKHPKNWYNYIAYNTIRMYDTELAKDEHAIPELWNEIINVIPYYQKNYDIDGAFIDMGHAMPGTLMSSVIKTCRNNNPDFVFLSESFFTTQHIRDQGYNATVGYLWQHYQLRDWRNKIDEYCRQHEPIFSLASAETHDTPRTAMRVPDFNEQKEIFWRNFNLPRSVPFIHAGSEFGETMPLNTGLGFSADEIHHFSKMPLALFDRASMSWMDKNSLTDHVAYHCHKRNGNHT